MLTLSGLAMPVGDVSLAGLPAGELAPGFMASPFRNAVVAEAVEALASPAACSVRGVKLLELPGSEPLCEYYRRDPFGIWLQIFKSKMLILIY